MIVITLVLYCSIFGGLSLSLFLMVRGLTSRATDAGKCLAIGLFLPIVIVVVPLMVFASLTQSNDHHTDMVTLKGRVVTSSGNPVEGVEIEVTPLFTGSDSGEMYKRYPRRKAVSDSTGVFELTKVKPLDVNLTAWYLVNPEAAERLQQFVYGQITARPTRDRGYRYTEPQLTLPLVSENRFKQARRFLLAHKMFGRGYRESKDVILPRSEGDVIFLPDIIIDDRG